MHRDGRLIWGGANITKRGEQGEPNNNKEGSSSGEIGGVPKRQKKLTEYANIQVAMRLNEKKAEKRESMRKIPKLTLESDKGEQMSNIEFLWTPENEERGPSESKQK